jgi:hypothetical protein
MFEMCQYLQITSLWLLQTPQPFEIAWSLWGHGLQQLTFPLPTMWPPTSTMPSSSFSRISTSKSWFVPLPTLVSLFIFSCRLHLVVCLPQ